MRTSIVSLLLLIGVGNVTPFALTPLAAAQQSSKSHIDLALTYDASRANLTTGNSFWLQGGGVEIAGILPHGFGVVGRVTGLHSGGISPTQVPLSLVTATFGPRYTWHTSSHPKKRDLSLFGQALAGDANGFDSVFPGATHASTSALSLALQVGGGVDLGLSRHASLRLLQADWLRTQLPNGSTNVQNHLQLDAGVVVHF